MITFIPAWQDVSSGETSTDDLIGSIQALKALNYPFRIIVGDYLPNLRYFLHRFGILESDYVNVFDQLQGFETEEQLTLTFDDLGFIDTVNYVYTPLSVLVFLEGVQIGEIRLAEGSHISEVYHYRLSTLVAIDIYDDRGFLSSRKVFENGQHVYTEYLDRSGERVFMQDQGSGKCIVNRHNSRGLNQSTYPNLSALISERLEANLTDLDAHDLMVSVHDGNKSSLSRSLFLEDMVLSYFSSRNQMHEANMYLDQLLYSRSRAVIVDSDALYDRLSRMTGTDEKVHKISPFDTRFTLSITQEVKEEVLYFDMRQLSEDDNQSILKITFDTLRSMMDEEKDRRFKIKFRTSHLQGERLKSFYLDLVNAHYPEEVALLQLLDFNNEGENPQDGALSDELKLRLSFVQHLMECFEVLSFTRDEDLFKVLHDARILLDLSPVPDLFTQIAGISSGIPQINRVNSDYVQAGKNGWLLQNDAALPEALGYYLDKLKYWQEARIYSVQQIKRFSGFALCQKILDFFKGDTDV